MDAATAVAERFDRFARDEAPGRSDRYADWAAGVAADTSMAELLASIPADHRQPPLVFAVTRMLGAPEAAYAEWGAWVREHVDEVVASARSAGCRRTSPCDARRCCPR